LGSLLRFTTAGLSVSPDDDRELVDHIEEQVELLDWLFDGTQEGTREKLASQGGSV
jgi:hypothetical protein